MHWGGNFGMGFGTGWIFMILFWGLVILGIVFLVKLLGGSCSSSKNMAESAEDILKKRFARGEISREEFNEAIAVLQNKEKTHGK